MSRWPWCVLLLASTSAAQKTMTMEELEQLERDGSFLELLVHARDIGPKERDAAWRERVANAATRQLPTVANDGDPMRKTSTALEWQRWYPFLAESKAWLSGLRELAPPELAACLEQSYRAAACAETFTALVNGTQDAALAYAGGKVTTQKGNAQGGVALYSRGFELGADSARCGEDALQRATLAALGLPPESALAKSARGIARDHCWETLGEKITRGLAGASDAYRQNTCPIALEKRAVTGLLAKKCAALK